MRRTLAPCVGQVIQTVERPRCRLKPILLKPRIDHLRRRLLDQEITGTGRAGKRVIVELGSTDRIVFEPRMTGLVLIADPPNTEHLRFQIGLNKGQLLYWDRRGLGSVRLFSKKEFDAAFGIDKLGPDALDITAEVLRERLGASRREIKVALLDQRAVAGIGNLYAAEILYLAKIHPRRPCNRLTKRQWSKISDATVEILREAILHEGSTLGDGTYRNALNQKGQYQNYHRVYMREGDRCPRCRRAEIQRIVQTQRSTFFCPGCQRL